MDRLTSPPPLQPPDPAPRRRVLAVGYNPEQRVALLNQLYKVMGAGGEALLVVADAKEWAPVHPAITVVELTQAERRVWLNRVMGTSPLRLVGIAGGLLVAMHSRRPLARRAGASVASLLLLHPNPPSSPWFDRWLASGIYRDLRPWVLWRATRSHLDVIDPATLDEVLQRDPACWAVAWQLLQINPGIRVSASIDPDATSRFAAERAEWMRRHGIRERLPVKRRIRSRIAPIARPVLRRIRARRPRASPHGTEVPHSGI